MGYGIGSSSDGARLASGFADPVFDSQRAFRAAMDALANPGKVLDVKVGIEDAPLP
ncbi:MAG: phosphonate C-P lyase system protein PhnH, partial [Beijerinckiaceae bacterium]